MFSISINRLGDDFLLVQIPEVTSSPPHLEGTVNMKEPERTIYIGGEQKKSFPSI